MEFPSRAGRALFLFCAIWLQVILMPHAKSEETTTYEYDALGRLVQVSKDDGTVVDYDYDAAGNRQSKETSSDGSGGSGGSGGGPTNNPPTAVNDSTRINLDIGVRTLNLVYNDTDPDGDVLTVTAVTQPWNATVTIQSGGTVLILADWVGSDTFEYTVSDGNGGTDTGIVSVVVWQRTGGDRR